MGGKPAKCESPHRLRKERFKSHLPAQMLPKPVSQPIVCPNVTTIPAPFVIPSLGDPNFSDPNPLFPVKKATQIPFPNFPLQVSQMNPLWTRIDQFDESTLNKN